MPEPLEDVDVPVDVDGPPLALRCFLWCFRAFGLAFVCVDVWDGSPIATPVTGAGPGDAAIVPAADA